MQHVCSMQLIMQLCDWWLCLLQAYPIHIPQAESQLGDGKTMQNPFNNINTQAKIYWDRGWQRMAKAQYCRLRTYLYLNSECPGLKWKCRWSGAFQSFAMISYDSVRSHCWSPGDGTFVWGLALTGLIALVALALACPFSSLVSNIWIN